MARSDVNIVKLSHIEKPIFLPTLQTNTIFANWKFKILLFLEQEGLIDAIQGNVDNSENFEKKDCEARIWIVLSIDDELLKIVKNCKSAQDMIKQLEVHFRQKSAFSKYDLKKQLLTMKLEPSESLQTHFGKFDMLISELEAVGCNLDESDKVCHLLLTLPEEYKTIVASLDAMMSLSESLMEFIKARLLDTAMRLKQTELNSSAEHGTCLTAVDNRQLFQPTEPLSPFEEYPNSIDDSHRTDSPVTFKSETEELGEMLKCNVVLQDVAKELCCEVCSRWCISAKELQTHKQTHVETPMAPAVKSFRCVLCHADFTSKITLVEHFKTHTKNLEPIIHHTKTTDSPIIIHENSELIEQDLNFQKETGAYESKQNPRASKFTPDTPDVHSHPKEQSDSENEDVNESLSPYELCPDTEVASVTDSRASNVVEPQEVCLDSIGVEIKTYPYTFNKSEKVWLQTATVSLERESCTPVENKSKRYVELVNHLRIHGGQRIFLFRNESMNRDKKLNQDKKPIICEYCNKEFRYLHHMLRHKVTHTGEKNFCCDICNNKFSLRNSLIKHIKTVHEGHRQCCYNRKQVATGHDKVTCSHIHSKRKYNMNPDKKPIICEYCNKEFSNRRDMLRHKVTHTGEKNFCCDICNNKFSLKISLIKHIKTVHEGHRQCCYNRKQVATGHDKVTCSHIHSKRKYNMNPDKKPTICEYCNKEFSDRRDMLRHKVVHTGEKNFCCDICNNKFSFKYSLVKHIQVVHNGEKNYQCSICGKRFGSRTSQIKHVAVVHNKINSKRIYNMNPDKKPIICEYCNKEFSNRTDMLRHKVVHTGEKNFCCDICNNKFSLRYSLVKHIQIVHNGEKNYQCSICGKCFASKTYQIRHVDVVHNKIKLFECEVCGRRFGGKAILNNHLKSHSDIKPFQCEICGKGFKVQSSFQRHQEKVHT